MRSRKYEHEIFNKHEKSKHHQQALSELNKSSYCLSTSMTANIHEMTNTDNSSSNHHHNNHVNSMNTVSHNSVYDECEGYRISNVIQDNPNGRNNNGSVQENYHFINNIHNGNINNNIVLSNSIIYDVIANNNNDNINNNNNNGFSNIDNNKQSIRSSYPPSHSQGSVVTSLSSQIYHDNEISSNNSSSSSSWGNNGRGKNDGNRIHDNSVGHGNSLDYDFDSQHPAHEHALMLTAIAHGKYLQTFWQ